jgi:hypothetical protein
MTRSLVLLLSLVPPQEGSRAGIGVWDTGRASAAPLESAAIAAKAGWTPLSDAAAPVKGDAVLSNGRVLAVFRKQDGAIDFYALSKDAAALRARLVLQSAAGEPAAKGASAAVVENGRAAAAIEVAARTSRGADLAARFRLKRGEVALEVQPGMGSGRLRLECPGRFVVLPDFFSDDIVIDAGKIPVAFAELPSENFLLHLAGKGEAIAMCVFENREQDVRVTLSGEGERRVVTGSEIEFGKEKKLWVALLEAPGIWHSAQVRPGDSKKVTRLDWTMPFAAFWRCDFTRTDELTDSWDLLLQNERDGEYVKPAWLGRGPERIKPDRKRWTTVLGSFPYPCWSDPDRQVYLQPLEHKALSLRGPVTIYPFARTPETPADAFTVVDVARNALGVGPCEYILDQDGHRAEYKGRATCSTRDLLTAIYTAGEQKKRRKEVEKALDDVLLFVKHIRGRIAKYLDFCKALRASLAERAKAQPELKDRIADLEKVCQEAESRYAAREAKIRTPEYVAGLNEDFRKTLVDYEGADAVDRVKAFAKAVVEVGDNQDELSGELRWVVRTLRQKAGLLMATEPKMASIAAEVRAKTQEVMRNPAGHEGARH